MRSFMLIAVVVCLLMATAGAHAQGKTVDGDLSDWGWDVTNKTFDPTGYDIEFCSGWDATNNHITDELPSPYSGGEWFDIELLCMDIVYNDNYIQAFNWAMVTSYAGWEPNDWEGTFEWSPNTSWNGDPSGGWGTAVSGDGIYAKKRDGANVNGFDYPVNPVIGISLDNRPATDGKSKYEYGLVVDPSDTQTLGNIDVTNAQLWEVTEGWEHPTGDTWVPGNYYDQEVCFDATKAGNTVAASNGTSMRRYGYRETAAEQWQGGSYPWQQYHNWFWEGSIDVSSLGLEIIDVGAESGAHYAMWCGNDHVETTYTPEGGGGPTPELPPGALLLLGMAPLGLRWWRNRRQ